MTGAVMGSNGSTTTDSSSTPIASHDAMAVSSPVARYNSAAQIRFMPGNVSIRAGHAR